MKGKRPNYALLGILVVAAIVLAFTMRGQKDRRPAPSVEGYYTGPMRNKSNPSIYSTDAGQKVPPPPGASTSATWAPVQLEKVDPEAAATGKNDQKKP